MAALHLTASNGPLEPEPVVGLGVFSGAPFGPMFCFLTLGLQGILYIKTVSAPGPGRSRLLQPFLFQLCLVSHWTSTAARLSPGHTESGPNLAEDLTAWLGSDVPGSQENHFAKGSPLPMSGLGNNTNNLSLKMFLGM